MATKTKDAGNTASEVKADVSNKLTAKQLFTTTAQITEATAKAVKAAGSVQQQYQRIAASAIVHLGTHKDIRVIRNILDTLPEGLRKQSLSAYFDAFAPLSFDEQGQVNYDKAKPVKLADALRQSWWLMTKEAAYKPFDFEAELNKLIARAEKRAPLADSDKGDKVNMAQVLKLQKLAANVFSAPADVLAA